MAMKEGLYTIFSILIGRYVFEKIGSYVRLVWNGIFPSGKKTPNPEDDWGLDKHIDTEGFKNRVVGFIFVMLCLLILLRVTGRI